jgi:hypothetical protein
MKHDLTLESLRKEYISRLLASKASVNDVMPLFAKAKEIFDLVKKGKKSRTIKKTRKSG